MITKELNTNKMCLFCASDYHLEMILLPYIKERIDNSKFIILTENNLEETLKTLLNRLNIDDKSKKKLWNLGWKDKNIKDIEQIKAEIKDDKEINIIINGEYDYIKAINNHLKDLTNEKINIIDCFHVGDCNVDIDNIRKDYKYILNTQKI